VVTARITLEMAQRAIDTILASAKAKGYTIAIAIADETGDFVATVKMDDSYLRWSRNARRKAYTSAIMGRDTTAFFEEMKMRGRTVADYGDPMLTTYPGGVAVYAGKRCIGGIGITGAAHGHDEDLAKEGLASMKLIAEVGGEGDWEALFGGRPK
jgi:glc operon protein GlcG